MKFHGTFTFGNFPLLYGQKMQAYSLYFHKDKKFEKFTASGEFFFILH